MEKAKGKEKLPHANIYTVIFFFLIALCLVFFFFSFLICPRLMRLKVELKVFY